MSFRIMQSYMCSISVGAYRPIPTSGRCGRVGLPNLQSNAPPAMPGRRRGRAAGAGAGLSAALVQKSHDRADRRELGRVETRVLDLEDREQLPREPLQADLFEVAGRSQLTRCLEGIAVRDRAGQQID